MKSDKKTHLILLFSGAALVVLGFFVIYNATEMIPVLIAYIGSGVLFAGVVNISLSIISNKIDNVNTESQFSWGIIEIIAGTIILLSRFISGGIVPIIWGIATLYSSLSGLSSSLFLRKQGDKWQFTLWQSIVRFILAVLVIFNPLSWSIIIIDIIIGGYMILYGCLWFFIGLLALKRS